MKRELLGLALLVILVGCSSTINFVSIDADNGSMIEGEQSTPITQDASGEGAFATQGAAAALGALSDVVSKYTPDFSQKTTNPPLKPEEKVTPPAVPTVPEVPNVPAVPETPIPEDIGGQVPVTPEPPVVVPPLESEFTKSSTYESYGVRNGGRQAWRIPKKGPDFGDKIKIVFSSGKTYYIYNTSKNCRGDNPNTCDIPSDKNKDGFVFKSGIGPNGEGDTNTGTSHGGVYLHASYGDDSKSVTFYYNGK